MTMQTNPNDIKEHMPIVCSDGKQFGVVDRVEGDSIKVAKDKEGKHHWMPLSWVTEVDDKVHVDRPGNQAMQDWFDAPPMAA